MREIIDGVFHWTTFHENIGQDVSSYYLAHTGMAINPKLPDDGLGALPGEVKVVVLTNGHHTRDAAEFAEHFGVPIRVSQAAAERIGGELAVETYGDDEQLAPGVTARHVGRLSDDEEALHIAVGPGAIAFADGVVTSGGELGFVPDELLGDDPEDVKRGLKDAFRKMLELEFDALLPAHGDPIASGGKDALRAFAA